MNKKIFMIIITCVTVLCIIVGAAIHLNYKGPSFRSIGRTVNKAVRQGWAAAKNAREDDSDYDYDDDLDLDFDADEKIDGAQIFTNSLEAFDSVYIDSHVMGVSIQRGNRFEISGSYTKAPLKPGIKVSGGTLNINQPDYKRNRVSNGNCKIKITVPFGTTLESVEASIDVGAVELKGIDVDDIVLTTDVGAISVDNVEFRELKATSDVGAVSLKLAQPLEEYMIEAKSDIGGIQVNNINCKRKYSQDGTTNKRIKVKTDVGGIDIK